MHYPDILTPRLRLVCLSPSLMHADLARNNARFADLLRAEVPDDWPPEHWEPHCFEFIERLHAEHPYAIPWSRYVALRGSPDVLIGTVGAFPRSRNEAEFGYGILPHWQRRGFATEAAQALIDLVFGDKKIEAISAQTLPSLRGSLRVMEKCGLEPAGAGDEDGTVRYRRTRQIA